MIAKIDKVFLFFAVRSSTMIFFVKPGDLTGLSCLETQELHPLSVRVSSLA